MLDILCPTCKTKQKVRLDQGGLKVPCSKCGQRLLVPANNNRTVLAEKVPAVGTPVGIASLVPDKNGAVPVAEFYYMQNCQRLGPIDVPRLHHLVRTKQIDASDRIWSESAKEWYSAGQIMEISGFDSVGEPRKATSPGSAKRGAIKRLIDWLLADRRRWLGLFCIAGTIAAVAGFFWQRPNPSADPFDGQKIYEKALPSCVFIDVPGVCSGSGVLVNSEQRLVVTNYHVVLGGRHFHLFFPERDGEIVTKRDRYLKNAQHDPGKFQAKFVAGSETKDLAILQLNSLPSEARPIHMAKTSATPGERVHSIGSPGIDGPLWVYTFGAVRSSAHRRQWQSRDPRVGVLKFDVSIIETQSPTNRGDSGGPLLNDRAELVGLTQGFFPGELNSVFIDVNEIRSFLKGEGYPIK